MAATRRAPLRVCCCLQAKGFNVRATVRSKADAAKEAHLTCLATALPGAQTTAAGTVTLQATSLRCSTMCAALCCMPTGSVEVAEADLLVEGAFDAAFAGCRYIAGRGARPNCESCLCRGCMPAPTATCL